MMDEASKKKVDAILFLARSSFSGRRRRSIWAVLVVVALLLVLLGLIIWLSLREESLPPLLLAAYDQVALPDEKVSLHARLEAVEEQPAEPNLAGCPMYFQLLNNAEVLGKVESESDGCAHVERSFSDQNSPWQFWVRYRDDRERRRGAEAKARVFVWPAEAALLIVDAERTLPGIDSAKLWTTSNLDIRPVPDSAGTLRAARGKFRVVYLAGTASRPSSFNKLRAWLDRDVVQNEQFPDGPLLAPACNHDVTDPSAFARATLDDLNKRFKGASVAVAGRVEEAKLFKDAGLKTYLLGDAKEIPEGVHKIKSWKELSGPLAK